MTTQTDLLAQARAEIVELGLKLFAAQVALFAAEDRAEAAERRAMTLSRRVDELLAERQECD